MKNPPDIKIQHLSDEAQSSFNKEYHSPNEYAFKMEQIQAINDGQALQFLDLGGGNGIFLDRMLDKFTTSEGVNFDISDSLLEANLSHPRKEIVQGDVADLRNKFPNNSFDVIFVNWVLHHLVGTTYKESQNNIAKTLTILHSLVKDDGIIIISENFYEGFLIDNLPSHLIFHATSIQMRPIRDLIARLANTAGVGVSFHSSRSWRRIFMQAGFEISDCYRYLDTRISTLRQLGTLTKSFQHGHIVLRRRTV